MPLKSKLPPIGVYENNFLGELGEFRDCTWGERGSTSLVAVADSFPVIEEVEVKSTDKRS